MLQNFCKFLQSKNRILKINKYLKIKPMKKQLELNENDALKLYPTASSEFKQMLELNFGNEFFNRKITERIKDYDDILSIGNYNENNDVIKIDNFDEAENKVVKAFIKKMRISKVYRENWIAKRNENRWYPWYSVSSGFEFEASFCDLSCATADSSSRLCFPNEECAKDFTNKKLETIDGKLDEIKQYSYSIENKVDTIHKKVVDFKKAKKKN